ncbi:MAG TPA: iron-containing redox enzyme family protein [Acidimicrobiales bacterium]|nr:iron-containing redox enzyme family protein [Acidimicrobiales bacterium]
MILAMGRQPGTFEAPGPVPGIDVLTDDDFGLALYLCYEQHYRSVADPDWEWDLGLLQFRAELERAFLDRLLDEVGYDDRVMAGDVLPNLDWLTNSSSGPSLSGYFVESGTLEQLREFCVHRSAYQLKEADPHTFAIPRLTGEAKAALVDIQIDEYGSGQADKMHSSLFADTLTALGLDPSYGSYVEILPGVTLATVNLVSMFGLHRRWRGALVGHLAVFEMTSVVPMGRYSSALARFGIGPEGRRFYDVHVQADALHGVVARDRMVAGLVRAEPELSADVLFGAAAVTMLEKRFTRHLLNAWAAGRSSLSPWQAVNPEPNLP